MIETENAIPKGSSKNITRVPCSKCDRVFKVVIDEDVLEKAERFPFPIVLMHYSDEDKDIKQEVHTLIAYIDKQLNCRHVTVLDGKRVFITPYILYNPDLIVLSCSKNLGGY